MGTAQLRLRYNQSMILTSSKTHSCIISILWFISFVSGDRSRNCRWSPFRFESKRVCTLWRWMGCLTLGHKLQKWNSRIDCFLYYRNSVKILKIFSIFFFDYYFTFSHPTKFTLIKDYFQFYWNRKNIQNQCFMIFFNLKLLFKYNK